MQMLHDDDLEICFILAPISAIELSLSENHRPTADVNNVNFRFLFMKDCYDRIYVNFQKLWRVVQTFSPPQKKKSIFNVWHNRWNFSPLFSFRSTWVQNKFSSLRSTYILRRQIIQPRKVDRQTLIWYKLFCSAYKHLSQPFLFLFQWQPERFSLRCDK